jgi:type VI secretion system protein ImpA
VGALRSREDVRRTLAQVCEWLERNEPGHPAPLLIQRASRLLDMTFIEIMQDMAPSGVPEVYLISGTKPPEE